MEPLSGLGAASSVVQLLTFAITLLDKGRQIYKAADGATIENNELESTAKTLNDLLQIVVQDSAELPLLLQRGTKWKDQRKQAQIALQNICKECQQVVQELLGALNDLKSRKKTKWKSFRLALACVWSESRIQSMARRLQAYRNALDTALLISIR